MRDLVWFAAALVGVTAVVLVLLTFVMQRLLARRETARIAGSAPICG